MKRIWVHKPDHLGDAVLARPALHTLHQAWPDALIRVACHPAAAPLLAADGFAALPWDSPFLGGAGSLRDYRRSLRDFAPDLIVNLRHDFRDILFCLALGARRLGTYDHRGLAGLAAHAGPPPREDVGEADNHVALLQATLKLDPVKPPPLQPTTSARKKAAAAWAQLEGDGPKIALHVAARTSAKCWPLAHWRELIAVLQKQSPVRLALLGEAADGEINRAIADDNKHVADWSGRFDLDETAAVIAQGDLLIGVDSGPGHIAKAVGTPVLSLMSGANSTVRWAPDPATALAEPVDCAPCHRERCPVAGHPCLRGITHARVVAAVEGLVGR